MKLRGVVALTVLVLSGSPILAGSATAQTSTPERPTIVSGHVTRDGKSIYRATVFVSAWPNQASINTLTESSRIDMIELGKVLGDRYGTYTFEVLPSRIPADYRDDQGGVNLRLLITDGDQLTVREVTVGRLDDKTGGKDAQLDSVDLSTSRASNLSRLATNAASSGDAVAQQIVLPASAMLNEGQVASALDAKSTTQAVVPLGLRPVVTPVVPYMGCYAFTGARHGPYLETYGTVYAGPGVKGKVEHYAGASHTIGIAAKASGGWYASGSQTLSSQAGYTTSFNVADAYVKNYVYQRYYYTKCDTTGSWVTVLTQSKPDLISSGPQFSYAGHVNYAYCTTTYKGVTYSTSTTKEGTVAGGMDLPFINVSAQSGWNSSVKFSFYFSRAGKICGNRNTGWLNSSLISTYAS